PDGPYMATIILVKRVVGPKTPRETCHVIIYHGGNVPYWAGQSYGIIPSLSGENPKTRGNANNACGYSIASTRYKGSFDRNTASLCVWHVVYSVLETSKDDASKRCVYSKLLCKSKLGDKIHLTG
ncbi:hypothetical protein ZWY2020_014033, partial [Hordeum vulgare]